MTMTFDTFKRTVTQPRYEHMFPDSHFEEGDYDGEPLGLAADIEDTFGVMIDLLNAQAKAVAQTNPYAADHVWLYGADILRQLQDELNHTIVEHYDCGARVEDGFIVWKPLDIYGGVRHD